MTAAPKLSYDALLAGVECGREQQRLEDRLRRRLHVLRLLRHKPGGWNVVCATNGMALLYAVSLEFIERWERERRRAWETRGGAP